MTASESAGGILGGLMVLGVSLWGVSKIEKAFSNKNHSKDSSEPF